MSDRIQPKLARPPVCGRVPSRDSLAAGVVATLKQGTPSKADVQLVDVGEGVIVVKDFAAKPWWARLLGRLQTSREYGAYRWLGAFNGVPRLVGRVDALALAIEKIDGVELAQVAEETDRAEAHIAGLRDVIDRMHAAGLAHLDLRNRENVFLRDDGRILVLDLASAIWLRPRGWLHRLLFPLLRLTDESAFLKWKQILGQPLDAGEQGFLRRYRFWRSLWVFNPKGRKGKPSADD